MSKGHGIFIENCILYYLFPNAGKTGNGQILNLINSRKPSFGDYLNVTFTS